MKIDSSLFIKQNAYFSLAVTDKNGNILGCATTSFIGGFSDAIPYLFNVPLTCGAVAAVICAAAAAAKTRKKKEDNNEDEKHQNNQKGSMKQGLGNTDDVRNKDHAGTRSHANEGGIHDNDNKNYGSHANEGGIHDNDNKHYADAANKSIPSQPSTQNPNPNDPSGNIPSTQSKPPPDYSGNVPSSKSTPPSGSKVYIQNYKDKFV